MPMIGKLARRYGRFELDYELLEKHPDVARRILSEVLVVRAEALYGRRVIAYDGYAAAFDEITEFEPLPSYDIEVDQEADEIRWIRVAA